MDWNEEVFQKISKLAFVEGDTYWCSLFSKIMQAYQPDHLVDRHFPFLYEDVFWILAPFYAYVENETQKVICNTESISVINVGEELLRKIAPFAHYAEKQLYNKNNINKGDSFLDTFDSVVRHKVANELKTADGYWNFAEQFPMCIRMCTLCVKTFLDGFNRMITRLEKDIEKVAERFGISTPCHIEITPLSSDLHEDSTGVYRLKFDSVSVVYKGRNIRTMAFLLEFSKILNYNEKWLPLFLEKEDYGYVEWIENDFPNTQENMAIYFSNWGKLLAIFYLLSGSDLLQENLLQSTLSPVWIDTETCIQPCFEKSLIYQNNEPFKLYYSDLFVYSNDVSRLGVFGFDVKHALDSQLLTLSKIKMLATKGFVEMWKKILSCKSSLVRLIYSNDFSEMPIRFIVRDTSVYQRLSASFYSNERLSNPQAYLSNIYRLYNAFPKEKVKIPTKESIALLNGSIPIFTAKLCSHNLFHGDEVVCEEYFDFSATERFENQIDNMTNQDVSLFVNIIEEFLNSMFLYNKTYQTTRWVPVPKVADIKEDIINKCEKTVHQIASELKKSALYASDNSIVWTTTRKYLGLTDYSLFSGTAGIALFLSLYGKNYNDKTAIKMSKQIYSTVADKIMKNIEVSDYSFTSGFAGIMYGMLKISEILSIKDKPALEKGFHLLAKSPNLSNDDLYQGNSGVVFSLSSYLELNDEDKKMLIKKSNDLCIGNLLEKPTFAHGNAGIAFALLSAYRHTSNIDYCNKAIKILSSLKIFDDGQIHGLCASLTGVAYAAQFVPEELRTTHIKNIINEATYRNVSNVVLDNISLCCGESGVLMFLMKQNETESIEKHLSAVSYPENYADKTLSGGKAGFGLTLLLYIMGFGK